MYQPLFDLELGKKCYDSQIWIYLSNIIYPKFCNYKMCKDYMS